LFDEGDFRYVDERMTAIRIFVATTSGTGRFAIATQFEAYRSLSEHVGNKLFLKAVGDQISMDEYVEVEKWFSALGQNLLTVLPEKK